MSNKLGRMEMKKAGHVVPLASHFIFARGLSLLIPCYDRGVRNAGCGGTAFDAK
jgi:hypothetical protein